MAWNPFNSQQSAGTGDPNQLAGLAGQGVQGVGWGTATTATTASVPYYSTFTPQPNMLEIGPGTTLGPNLEEAFKKIVQDVIKEELGNLKEDIVSILRKIEEERVVLPLVEIQKGLNQAGPQ